MVLSQTEREAWRETGANALRVAKIKKNALWDAATSARSTVQASPQAQTAVKMAGGVGKVAKFGVPVLGAAIDFGTGLAGGEDPIRAGAGAVGSTAGGAAGAWGGAAAGAAIGAPLAPFTFGLSSVAGGVIGGIGGAIGGSLAGGWAADRVDQAVRGQQPVDRQRQQPAATGQTGTTRTGGGNNPNWNQMGDATYNAPQASYPDIKGRFQPNPNATYSYQPMRPDGSGGFVAQGGVMPSAAVPAQPTRNGRAQPANFTQPAATSPDGGGTVNVSGTNYLRGFEPGARNGAFTESAAAGAQQSPAPNRDGQLVQAGFFNPASVAKVAAPAATGAAKVAGKAPINPVIEFGKEALKQTAFLPLLGAAGLLYRPAPAAPPPAAGVAALKYANPQPAWWDQALFGGAINRTFGQPQGFEYQKLDVDSATKRREQDVRQNTTMRGQDVQTYKTDVGAETQRRGQDLGLIGKDLTSGRQLEGRKYTADRQFQGRELQYGQGGSADRGYASKERQVTQTNQTNLQRETVKGEYGNQREGIKGEYGLKRETVKGEYGNQREAIKGQFGNQREGIKGEYGLKREDVKGQYTLANTGLRNEGQLKVADLNSGRRLQGQVYTADQRLTGTTYTADQRVNQESVRQSGHANVAGIRAGGQVAAAGVNAGGRVAAAQATSEGKVKVASIMAAGKAPAAEAALYQKSEAARDRENTARTTAALRASNDLVASDSRDHNQRLKGLGIYR